MRLHNPPILTGKYLKATLESGHLAAGAQVEALRWELGAYFGVSPETVVLGSSATALGLALFDYLEKEHRWIRFPELSPGFNGHTSAVVWPVFRNMFRRHNVDAKALVGSQRGQWLTDIGGASVFQDEVDSTLVSVLDACHSWRLLEGVDFTLLSFYPTKLCAGAEGGAIVCTSSHAAADLQRLVNCGLDRAGDRPSFYHMDYRGRKASMTDVTAALNREALEGLGQRKRDVHQQWVAMRDQFLSRVGPKTEVDRIVSQPEQAYLLQLRVDAPAKAFAIADEVGVATQVNFPPSTAVTFPCWPGLALYEQELVFEAMVEASKV